MLEQLIKLLAITMLSVIFPLTIRTVNVVGENRELIISQQKKIDSLICINTTIKLEVVKFRRLSADTSNVNTNRRTTKVSYR